MRSAFHLLAASGLAVGAAALLLRADVTPAAPAHKNYSESVKGPEDLKASFDMVALPGGTFEMGSLETEPGRSADEGPRRKVTVGAFWMAKCEATWDEVNIFRKEREVEETGAEAKAGETYSTRPTPPYVDETYGHGVEGFPALCMSHHFAMEYCRWLSEKTGKPYRLPTEAEWEYAARAGTQTAYSFGDDAAALDEHAWYKKNSPDDDHDQGTTHKAGTKKANPFGLHDLYGNVSEWCLDHYNPAAYKTLPALNPVILPTDKRFRHVTRGGSWADDAARCRSAARRGSEQGWLKWDPQRPQSIWWLTKLDVIGFRVVRGVDDPKELRGLRSKINRDSAYE